MMLKRSDKLLFEDVGGVMMLVWMDEGDFVSERDLWEYLFDLDEESCTIAG